MTRLKILLLFVLMGATAIAQIQPDTALAKTLAKLVVADQRAAGLPPSGTAINSPVWQTFKDSVFTSNYQTVKKLFETKGFPGYKQVGQVGAHDFWLIVQHCDQWPTFQEQVLQAMDQQVQQKNASAQNYAYLTDRVRINTNRPQVYGTQVTYDSDSCQAVPLKLEDPTAVNERRKKVGLERIEGYLDQMSENHFQMNRTFFEKNGIHRPKLYKDKAFGTK